MSFDDESGDRILDYIPVRRVSDGKVGFYYRAAQAFVASSGTNGFMAGTITNETPVVSVNAVTSTFRVSGIPGLVISIHRTETGGN